MPARLVPLLLLASLAAGLVVHSPSALYRGRRLRSNSGRIFEAFSGIRYALPPVGHLRFQPSYFSKIFKEKELCTLSAQSMKNISKDEISDVVNWLKVKSFRNGKETLWLLQYKYEHSSEYQGIRICPKQLPRAYLNPKSIASKLSKERYYSRGASWLEQQTANI